MSCIQLSWPRKGGDPTDFGLSHACPPEPAVGGGMRCRWGCEGLDIRRILYIRRIGNIRRICVKLTSGGFVAPMCFGSTLGSEVLLLWCWQVWAWAPGSFPVLL